MEKAESLQVTRGDFFASLENDIKPVSEAHSCCLTQLCRVFTLAVVGKLECAYDFALAYSVVLYL